MRALILLALPALAQDACLPLSEPEPRCIRAAAEHYPQDLCTRIRNAALVHGIEPDFFARLIWTESRFNPGAVSPANAQGIAQFIPSTARLRGLQDPFNPVEALDASAAYLADLTLRFGNPGLAAIAYNGGETRAARFAAGLGALPRETRAYVATITGHPAEAWLARPAPDPARGLTPGLGFMEACRAQAAARGTVVFAPLAPAVLPWGVQLASHPEAAGAQRQWAQLQARFPSTLSDQSPDFLRRRLPGFGQRPRVTVRLGAPTRSAAQQLCNRLRSRGVGCAVYRN